MNIIYKDLNILSENQVKNLYDDAGWIKYSENIKKTLFGIQNSTFVYTAWHDGQLSGLVRALSDEYTICYIQDILVLKAYHSQGIGKTLIEKVLEKYKHVRQIVLITDEVVPKNFYEDIGFEKASDLDILAYLYIEKKAKD